MRYVRYAGWLGSYALTGALIIGVTLILVCCALGTVIGLPFLLVTNGESLLRDSYVSRIAPGTYLLDKLWGVTTASATTTALWFGACGGTCGVLLGAGCGITLRHRGCFASCMQQAAEGAARGAVGGAIIGTIGSCGAVILVRVTQIMDMQVDALRHMYALGNVSALFLGALLGIYTHLRPLTAKALAQYLRPLRPLTAPLSEWFAQPDTNHFQRVRYFAHGAVRGGWLGVALALFVCAIECPCLDALLPRPNYGAPPSYVASLFASLWGLAAGTVLFALYGMLSYRLAYAPRTLRDYHPKFLRMTRFDHWLYGYLTPPAHVTRTAPVVQLALPFEQKPSLPWLRCGIRDNVARHYIPPVGLFRVLMMVTLIDALWALGEPVTPRLLAVPFGCVAAGWLCAWVRRPRESALPHNLHDRSNLPLNLICFFMPPAGLATWLALDHARPRLARAAGRSAVRGVVVVYAAMQILPVCFNVNYALLAIARARQTPHDPVKMAVRIACKRDAWYAKNAPRRTPPHDNFNTDEPLTFGELYVLTRRQRPIFAWR